MCSVIKDKVKQLQHHHHHQQQQQQQQDDDGPHHKLVVRVMMGQEDARTSAK